MFVHDRNLCSKINKNFKNKKEEIEEFYYSIYRELFEKLCSINFNIGSDEEFILAATMIDNYLKDLDKFSLENGISSQSKFRSTFVEEISEYLFKNLEPIKRGELSFYNKNIYAGLKFVSGMEVSVLYKDVDFCIGKKVKLIINGRTHNVIMPVVAVEVKTYLDATMFGEVQYSARLIKNAIPSVKTYVLMEYNQVIKDKIVAARYDNALNEIFTLRANATCAIDPMVLKEYYVEISNAISKIEINDVIHTPGRLLHSVKEVI